MTRLRATIYAIALLATAPAMAATVTDAPPVMRSPRDVPTPHARGHLHALVADVPADGPDQGEQGKPTLTIFDLSCRPIRCDKAPDHGSGPILDT